VRINVTVVNNSNHDSDNIALTIPAAAGMEILSLSEQVVDKSKYDYRDLRDDRIHYYFSLAKGKSKTFSLLANTAYKGRYYLPAINAEAMYDGNMHARQKGKWITIGSAPKKEEPTTSQPAVAEAGVANAVSSANEISIKSLRAYLYDAPSEDAKTSMYLVIGDKAVLLNKTADNGDWLYIRYSGNKILDKWIKAETIK
jgi:hypothetical protein